MKSSQKGDSKTVFLCLITAAAVILTGTVFTLWFNLSELKKTNAELNRTNDEMNQMNEDLKQANEDLSDEKTELLEKNQQMQAEITDLTTKKGGIEEHGNLSVKGTQLYDEHNNPVVLRGMSSHGIAWYPEFANYRSLKTLKDYGANAFRIAMYVDQSNGYLEQPELNKKLLFSAIENSLEADLYTIVDWHVLRDENPNRNIDKAISAFEEIGQRYGNNPGIIYEICNEPNGDTTYEDITNYANRVIPVIRKYSPNAVILVGTPKYCSTLTEATENPLNYQNIMYTYHFYAGLSDCKHAIERITEAIDGGLPVFISEWGLKDSQGRDDTVKFLDFLNEKKISWINWSLCNKDEGYSMIDPDRNTLGGWSENDLTESGRLVLQYLRKTDTNDTE